MFHPKYLNDTRAPLINVPLSVTIVLFAIFTRPLVAKASVEKANKTASPRAIQLFLQALHLYGCRALFVSGMRCRIFAVRFCYPSQNSFVESGIDNQLKHYQCVILN